MSARIRLRGTPSRSKRLAGDEQRQRRIEPAGDADGDVPACRCVRAVWRARRPGCERSRRSVRAVAPGPAGTNGCASTWRAQPDASSAGVAPSKRNASKVAVPPCSTGEVAKAVRARPVAVESFDVDVGDQQRFVALKARRFRQQGAVLGDQAMAAEDEVGRRFVNAATSVQRTRPRSGPTGWRRVAGDRRPCR